MRTKKVQILILIGCIALFAIPAFADECEGTNECVPQYGVSAEVIEAYPEPNVIVPTPSEDLMYDRWYLQTVGATTVYDAPGGNVVRVIDEGFNYVTALQEENGWTRINESEWVPSDQIENRSWAVSHFTGAFLPDEELPYPFAWVLVNLYPSKAPGEDPAESNGLVYRYTMVNLYSTVEIDGYNWYQIGVDQWVHQFHVAKITPLVKPANVDTDTWVGIDLYEQTLIAYEGETPVFATMIATGLDRWPTREGVYHIYFRRARKHMSGGVVGDDYYFLEEVPWTMFFDEGRALHGAYWHDGFGFRRSHGCVNLSITDAHWLYEWVAESMGSFASADVEEGPAVYVYSTGEYN